MEIVQQEGKNVILPDIFNIDLLSDATDFVLKLNSIKMKSKIYKI